MGLRRVAVTGLGVVSAIGKGKAHFWESLCAGRHGFRPLTLVDRAQLQFPLGAEVAGLDLDGPFDASVAPQLDRFARLLLLATREAVTASGVSRDAIGEAAIVTGTAIGGQTTQDELFGALYRDGRRRLTPLAVPRIMASSGASQASMELGIEGAAMTLSTACASSNHAIGLAFWLVAQGATPLAIAGGSEAPFSLGHLKAWDGMRVVAPDACRPFSKDRKGLILGEGAGALVLEEMDRARARAAPIHAEICGFGMSSDAGHITKPSARGAARAIRAALADARVGPDAVDYISAHGTGTVLNDRTESEALVDVFGERATTIPVSATKSMHGHALGASGALEAVATVLALEKGVLPPTVGYLGPDPACPLDVVPNEARKRRVDRAISSSFAFGGLNAVLVFRRFDGV